jgi:acetyltransferase-like isoleucine patch superfamily enzyme
MPPMSLLSRVRVAAGDLPRRIGYVHGPRVMSALRRWWVLLRHRHADVRFLGPVYLGPGFSLHIPNGGSFVVAPGVEFRRGFRAEVEGHGRITIGADCVFTYYVLMQCTTSIDIGDRCMFGQSTIVVDGLHRFRDLDRPMLDQGYDFTPITIEDDATITTKCSIMADVGRRAFIGANSVVTRPAPPYCVMAGAPARPIDYFGPPGGEPAALRSEA